MESQQDASAPRIVPRIRDATLEAAVGRSFSLGPSITGALSEINQVSSVTLGCCAAGDRRAKCERPIILWILDEGEACSCHIILYKGTISSEANHY